jgi:pimeloyl-ACP methyl ester carboxylesterase
VLLQHGWPDSSCLWRKQIPFLVANGFRAITPDLRGLGRSDRPEGMAAYSRQNAAADVVSILDALGIDAVDIVAHDWGAAVAWSTAIAHPNRVRRLVILSMPHPLSQRKDLSSPEGCMGLNAISEFGHRDAGVTRITRNAARRQRQTLMRVFTRAKKQREIRSDADLDSMATSLRARLPESGWRPKPVRVATPFEISPPLRQERTWHRIPEQLPNDGQVGAIDSPVGLVPTNALVVIHSLVVGDAYLSP